MYTDSLPYASQGLVLGKHGARLVSFQLGGVAVCLGNRQQCVRPEVTAVTLLTLREQPTHSGMLFRDWPGLY